MADIKNALTNSYNKLQKEKIASAFLDAEVILSSVIGKPREFLFTHPERKLTGRQFNRFRALINQRATKIPVAYLTKQKEFFGLNFFVNKNVLIPRPETELLIEQIVDISINQKNNKTNGQKIKTIADIGTGSGCVAISIAKNIPNVRILATDISKSALTVARRNAKQLGATKKIQFFHGNLLSPINNEKIDIVVANLPYLPDPATAPIPTRPTRLSQTKEIAAELKHEPQNALYAGPDGLKIYEKLFKQISELKFKPRFVLIEIDHRQSSQIKKLIETFLPHAKIQIKKDLCGRDRVVEIVL
ncbi:MAG: peptide chain release factor N(5)-glutamine methyltransferase [Parcubacteria group bacterium]